MEAILRRPFQGVTNIIRFNWHFFLGGGIFLVAALSALFFTGNELRTAILLASACICLSVCISLAVSWYVYDFSPLYEFQWLQMFTTSKTMRVVNLHAGFDETSQIIRQRFPQAQLQVFDFYDAEKHTEVSVKRARRIYAPFPGTTSISTEHLPLSDRSAEMILNIFALHEIRNREERIRFMNMQRNALTVGGACIVMEHLRDTPNFLAYNLGALHFFPRKEWMITFAAAGLRIQKSFTVTPFVTVFILKPDYGKPD
jgi:hypothetical protein